MNGPAPARRKVCITIQSVNLNVRVQFGSTFSRPDAWFLWGFFVPEGTVLLLNCHAQLKQTVAAATAGASNQMFWVFGFYFIFFLNSCRVLLSSQPEVLSGKQMGRRS